jgi:hypothetical protein
MQRMSSPRGLTGYLDYDNFFGCLPPTTKRRRALFNAEPHSMDRV